MSKSFKLKNDMYLSGLSVKEKTVAQSDFLTLSEGFTIDLYDIHRIGNHFFGTIVCHSTTIFGRGTNTTPFYLKKLPNKSTWRPCGLATQNWSVEGIGYCYYRAQNGAIYINDQNNNHLYNYAVIPIDYVSV